MISLTKFDFALALVFTLVEIITLTVWIYVLNNPVAAIVTLAIGLYIEHVISRIQKKDVPK